MARKKTEIDLDDLLATPSNEAEDAKESEEAKEIKEDDLVVKPEVVEPLQTFAKEPAQPFKSPSEDAPKGVGGSYYIDATGTRVKR